MQRRHWCYFWIGWSVFFAVYDVVYMIANNGWRIWLGAGSAIVQLVCIRYWLTQLERTKDTKGYP